LKPPLEPGPIPGTSIHTEESVPDEGGDDFLSRTVVTFSAS
jgi:hypothetical protein